jgi:hypothetical protein
MCSCMFSKLGRIPKNINVDLQDNCHLLLINALQ